MCLSEVMEHYGIETQDSNSAGETLFLCPFHDDQSFGSASFNDEDMWNCFSCGFGGNTVQFVARKEGISTHDAYILLVNNFQDQINKNYSEVLEKCKVSIINLKTKYSLLDYKYLCNAFEAHILQELLRHRSTIEQYSNWISICSWVYIVDKQIVDEKYVTLLNLYSEFYSQMSSISE
jgi:DNA primase